MDKVYWDALGWSLVMWCVMVGGMGWDVNLCEFNLRGPA